MKIYISSIVSDCMSTVLKCNVLIIMLDKLIEMLIKKKYYTLECNFHRSTFIYSLKLIWARSKEKKLIYTFNYSAKEHRRKEIKIIIIHMFQKYLLSYLSSFSI